MNTEADLLQRLAISKKIMERHDDMGRGNSKNINSSQQIERPLLDSFPPVQASYNIPQEFMDTPQRTVSESRVSGTLEDRVSKSKLPDEIKKLMLEHPIQQPNMGIATDTMLTNDLIEKASRLMGTDAKGDPYKENRQQKLTENNISRSNINLDEIKKVVRETVEEVLHENGLLVENENKSSNQFKFRVGQHLFEGKVLKVKKMSK